MKLTGCFYNPRPSPGRCIKDTSYGKVDKECELVDNTCKLKSLNAVKNENISPMAIPIGISYQPKSVEKKNGKDKLSGPVSAFVCKYSQGQNNPLFAMASNYHDKSYNFFGDAHFSIANTCKPCQNFNKGKIDRSVKDCWDISVLLADTFSQAAKEKKWIDFYIELPYLPTEGYRPSKKAIESSVKDYIDKLYNIFYNCLNKLDCDYSTTRFHYLDIRLQHVTSHLPEIVENMSVFQTGEPFSNKPTVYEARLTYDLLRDAIKVLFQMIVNNNKENTFITKVDQLMKDFYFSGGKTATGQIEPKNIRLFRLYLTSDNFIEDVKNLMRPSLDVFKNKQVIEDALLPKHLIVIRDGKTMHKIRAQLYALEKDGKVELAQKIVQFFMRQYENNMISEKVRSLWIHVMQSYNNFINNRFKISAEEEINKLQNEFGRVQEIFASGLSGFSLLMDVYTLARMFRNFSFHLIKQDENKNIRNFNDHIDSVKSIVYAGANHIYRYVEFFEQVLNVPFIKYDPNKEILEDLRDLNKISRCLKVDIQDFAL